MIKSVPLYYVLSIYILCHQRSRMNLRLYLLIIPSLEWRPCIGLCMANKLEIDKLTSTEGMNKKRVRYPAGSKQKCETLSHSLLLKGVKRRKKSNVGRLQETR